MILPCCNSPQLHLYFHQVPWKAKLQELFVPRCGLKFDSEIGLEDFFLWKENRLVNFCGNYQLPVFLLSIMAALLEDWKLWPRIKHHGLKCWSLSFFCCWVFWHVSIDGITCVSLCVYVSQVSRYWRQKVIRKSIGFVFLRHIDAVRGVWTLMYPQMIP